MAGHKPYNHTSAILERLESMYLKLGASDLKIICRDGILHSYRLLMGACSELVRHCLDSEAEDGCLILPNISLWELKAFHSAVLCYKESPANEELDAVLKVLGTIGVNIGPYVDVNLTTTSELDVGDISTICFLNVDSKLETIHMETKLDSIPVESSIAVESKIGNFQEERGDEITLVIPSSLDVFPVCKSKRFETTSEKSLKTICSDEQMSRRLEEEMVDDISSETAEAVPRASKFCCPFCGKEFRNVSPYEKHLMEHQESGENKQSVDGKEDEKKKFSCELCDKTFTTSKQLNSHLKIHTDGKQFKCEICSKSFSVKSTLINHLKSHDERNKARRFICDICKKVFTHPSNLKRHIRSVHAADDDEIRNHACYMCGKRFKDASTLKAHMASHSESRDFPCSMCKKSYVKKSQLATHIRTHTGEKPFSCNLCGKSFKTPGNLKSHKIHRHIGVKLTKSHLCSECGQGFVKEYDLRVHLRRHRNERPFTCLTCGKKFFGERHFIEHNRTHTGEKPFQCETCKKPFSTSAGLRQHFKSYANCRLQATEGAYSKFPQKRSEWQRLGGSIQISDFMIPEGSTLHNLEGFSVQELKETEETVVYLSQDTDLSLVGGGIIETDIEGQVNIQTLPLQMDAEGDGEVLNLVEMSENL